MPNASSAPAPFMLPLAQINSTTSPANGAPPAATTAPAAPAIQAAPPAPVGPEAPRAPGTPIGGNTTQHAPGGPTTNDAAKQDGFGNWFMPIMLVGIVGLYFFMMRGQKKAEKARKQLLSEMKKGDKVQTIGGLVARVVSIDNDEVTLKIDESSNTKAVYKKAAIASVIVPDEKTK